MKRNSSAKTISADNFNVYFNLTLTPQQSFLEHFMLIFYPAMPYLFEMISAIIFKNFGNATA